MPRPNSGFTKSWTRTFSRISLRAKFLPAVLEIPDQLLLLGVDRDDRVTGTQETPHPAVDMLELSVPIPVARSLDGLAVRLQAVVELVKQVAHELMRHLVMLVPKFLGDLPDTLAGPAQRRFRVAACRWLDQALQVGQQGEIFLDRLLPSPTRPADPM